MMLTHMHFHEYINIYIPSYTTGLHNYTTYNMVTHAAATLWLPGNVLSCVPEINTLITEFM